MSSIREEDVVSVVHSEQLTVWRSADDMTYFIPKIADDSDYSSYGAIWFFGVSCSAPLWDMDLVYPLIDALESHMEHLGNGSLLNFLKSQKLATLKKPEMIEYAISCNMPSIDLWCVFAGLTNLNKGVISDEEIECLISSIKPLGFYDKSLLNIRSAFSFFSPVFPNSPINSSAAPKDKESMIRFFKAIALLTGEAKNLKEASENIDLYLTMNRKFEAEEIKAVENYVKKGYAHETLGVDTLNHEQFVKYFFLVCNDSDDQREKINKVLLSRVINGVELVSPWSSPFDRDAYFILTEEESKIYHEAKNSHRGDCIFIEDYDFLNLVRNPSAFLSYLRSMDAASEDYINMLANSDVDPDTLPGYNFNLHLHILAGLFNLQDIFEEYMQDQTIPFEMLLALKLEFNEKGNTHA